MEEGGYGAKYQPTILQSKQDGARHGLSSSECNKLFPVVQRFSFLPSWAGVTLIVSLPPEHIASDSAPMSLPPPSAPPPCHLALLPGPCRSLPVLAGPYQGSPNLRTDNGKAIPRARQTYACQHILRSRNFPTEPVHQMRIVSPSKIV